MKGLIKVTIVGFIVTTLGFCSVTFAHTSKSQRKASIKANPEWVTNVREYIRNGRIFVGMTESMVRASWGRPRKINRSVYSFGVHKQWIYTHHHGDSSYDSYVYFEDGFVTSYHFN